MLDSIKFLEITDDTKDQLKEVWMIIEPELMPILDDFYDYIDSFPVLAKLINSMDYDMLKKIQYQHWKTAMLGNLGSEYIKRTQRTGQAHDRSGLTPNWYITSYCFLLNRIHLVITKHYKKRYQLSECAIIAVNKVFMLDMGQAIASYEESISKKAEKKLIGIIEEFKNNVEKNIDVIASGSTQLSSSIGSIITQVNTSNN